MLGTSAVFAAGIMVRLSDVTPPIASFIPIEMIEGASTALGHWTVVAIARIVAIVDVAIEA